MKRYFTIISLCSLTLFGCGGSKTDSASVNASNNENKKVEVKKDTLTVNKEDKSTEEVKDNNEKLSRNGTYVNSQKSRLTITDCSEVGLKYKFSLKDVCDGITENGSAVFDGKNKAEVYSEDGEVIYSFTFKKDGSINFNLNVGPEFYGMDCIKFFDNQFEKK